jgi:hypothetical protein
MAPSSSIQQRTALHSIPNRTIKTVITNAIALTPQGEHILALYDEFKGRKVARTASTVKAANDLGETVMRDEDFRDVLKAIANDEFIKRKQVRTDLDFVYRKYDGFLDRVERARGKRIPGVSGGPLDYNEVVGWTEEQRAAYAHKFREEAEKRLPAGMTEEAFMQLPLEDRIAIIKQIRRQQEVI